MVLITGTNGFVGHKLLEYYPDAFAAPSLRNASEDNIKEIVNNSNADIIIHTAAISDIGMCENNPEESYYANVKIPVYLAKACKNIKLICFSSDQVYSGCKEEGPYTENNVNPINVYSKHKLEMEERVLDILPDAVMLRAEWMYDYYKKKSNYFMNVINAVDPLLFSSKQYRGITYLKEVVDNMNKAFSLPGGVYNYGSETTQSMFEITNDFVTKIGKHIEVKDAPGRHNLWMNCNKAKHFGIEFNNITEALIQCYHDNFGLIKKS